MIRNQYASVRLPNKLKAEVAKIAGATSRTLSSTIELLIRRGVEQFKRDGLLIELPPQKRAKDRDAETEAIARHIADRVAEILKEKRPAKSKK
jgi:hypothetical protein